MTIDHKLHDKLPVSFLYVLCGISSGVTSAVLTNPLDVLRTRYQVRLYSCIIISLLCGFFVSALMGPMIAMCMKLVLLLYF